MKSVGVREFRDHATTYLAGDEPLTIERHGEAIGVYIPLPRTKPESKAEAMARLGEAVDAVLRETGLTEDELVELFDVTKPFPLDDPNHPLTRKLDARAAGT